MNINVSEIKCIIFFNIYAFLILSSASVHASSDAVKQKTKVLTYNICTTYNLYGTKLDPKHRLPRIVQQIRDIDPDVVCLQEARRKEAEYLSKELMSLGYMPILSPRNGSKKGFVLITAHKEAKYFLQENKRWWYCPNNPNQAAPNKWEKFVARVLTVSALHRFAADGETPDYSRSPLLVFNTHLGVKEKQKTESLNLALKIMRETYSADLPRVFCGDFNFAGFNITDNEPGHKQNELLERAGYKDLVKDLRDLDGNEMGTFVGYSTDRFAPKVKKLSELDKLDGIFVRGVDGEAAQCLVAAELTPALESRDDLPSDHLPVFAEIGY